MKMQHHICATCGVQYPESEHEPHSCPVCNDQRQYVNSAGQKWTTLSAMRQSGTFTNTITKLEEGVFSIKTEPGFAIGQNAHLVKQPGFTLLWDCITYLDDATIERIRKEGGIDAIAVSHPHFYSTQVEWATAFDAPVYIHEDDRQWVARTDDRIRLWSGESLTLAPGMTLHRLGGHFTGSQVMHWENDERGKGILFPGDTIQVVADQRWVSFMYSYPNLIPLSATVVKGIAGRAASLQFDRIYSPFQRVVREQAGQAVQKSAERYIAALKGTLSDTLISVAP